MRENRLALLCEKQLNAILMEADTAFRSIVDSATTSVRLCEELRKRGDTDEGANGSHGIDDQMRQLLVSMQFHDEFSQRMRHVMELCRLLSEQEGNSSTQDPPLDRVAGIFSVSAEFSVLESIFPEYRHEHNDNAIELF